MRIIAKLALAVLGSALSLGAAHAQGMTITIATEGAYAPWNFTGPDGKLRGFEIDLANALCARIKAKCSIVSQDWDGIIPALQAKKYDAIMATMNITDKRRAVIDFSIPYASNVHGLGVMGNSPLTALAGAGQVVHAGDQPDAAAKLIDDWKPLLKGKVVGVQGSTSNAAFLDKYLKGAVEIREYKTAEQMDLDLVAGRIDAEFGAYSVIKASAEKPNMQGLRTVGAAFRGGPLGQGIAVGLRKEDVQLRAQFDEAIKAAIADGTVSKLSLQWLKVDVSPKK